MIRKLVFMFVFSVLLGSTLYFVIPQTVTVKTSCLVIEKSMEELILDSNIIIKGKVLGKHPSKWSNPDFLKGDEISNILQTDVKILVTDVLKGTPYNSNMILVRIDKGSTEGIEFVSDDIPDFIEGQDVLLFLSIDDSDVAVFTEDYYILNGMGQGLYIKEPYAENLYTCFYDNENQNIIEESLFREMIKTLIIPN